MLTWSFRTLHVDPSMGALTCKCVRWCDWCLQCYSAITFAMLVAKSVERHLHCLSNNVFSVAEHLPSCQYQHLTTCRCPWTSLLLLGDDILKPRFSFSVARSVKITVTLIACFPQSSGTIFKMYCCIRLRDQPVASERLTSVWTHAIKHCQIRHTCQLQDCRTIGWDL